MSLETPFFPLELLNYLREMGCREPATLQHIREHTQQFPQANMAIAPEQGQFLRWLVKTMQAKHIIEIGTFTGYSATVMALALPENGTVSCYEINPDYAEIAQSHWAQAGISHKIQLTLGDALTHLSTLDTKDRYDLAFVDADKLNYLNYYQILLPLIRIGGVLVFDNVLWSGRVFDHTNNQASTNAIRQFNQVLHQDPRIEISLLPLGDGTLLATKK